MRRTMKTILALAGANLAFLMSPVSAQADPAFGREILAELVAVNTAPSGGGDTREAVRLLVDRLHAGGFSDDDITVIGKSDTLPNLVVRYRSADPQHEPVLMMAHLDVVEALPADWSVPPFEATIRDGYLYGRGSVDNKAGAAMLIANFIRLRQQGFAPDRDLIVMLSADEESTGKGANFLATEHRDLIDADFALNTDGGSVILGPDGDPRAFVLQTAEKVYVTYTLTATDPGGHSSLPKSDSAISRLARTLVALEDYAFPINLNETSRGFFEQWSAVAPEGDRALLAAMAAAENGTDGPAEVAEQPYYNSLARTTCVATMLEGGHAENALPQTARATVNCRVLPQEPAADIEARIAEMAAPDQVSVEESFPATPSPPSPLRADVVTPVTEVARQLWPDIPVIPELSTGATDGAYFRNVGIPTYGVGAIAEDPNDLRIHGRDERIRLDAFDDALDYWYRLTKVIAGG